MFTESLLERSVTAPIPPFRDARGLGALKASVNEEEERKRKRRSRRSRSNSANSPPVPGGELFFFSPNSFIGS